MEDRVKKRSLILITTAQRGFHLIFKYLFIVEIS